MPGPSTVDHVVAPPAPPTVLTVLVYSDDANVRAAIRGALGTRPAPDLPEVRVREVATEPAVIEAMDAYAKARGAGPDRIDLAILDGEAVPAGGIGIARQLKDEIFQCPPLLVLTGRAQDGWLATWARAEAIVPHPIDPVRLADVAAALLRPRVA
jgi:CheY-like chemotaxis protein